MGAFTPFSRWLEKGGFEEKRAMQQRNQSIFLCSSYNVAPI